MGRIVKGGEMGRKSMEDGCSLMPSASVLELVAIVNQVNQVKRRVGEDGKTKRREHLL